MLCRWAAPTIDKTCEYPRTVLIWKINVGLCKLQAQTAIAILDMQYKKPKDLGYFLQLKSSTILKKF